MDLISLIIVLIVIGVSLWAVNTLLPIDGKIKQIINAVVIIVVVLWLLSLFTGYMPHMRVGK
jgi:low temperature requirement protein LtrA